MTPYLDGGFLLTLLVKTGGTATANRLLRGQAPFDINFLHQLQAENLLIELQHAESTGRQVAGSEGMRLWRHYLSEGIFQLTPADWESGFRHAIQWNSQSVGAPALPLLILHPALAFTAGAREFLSFDPRSRAVAKAAGLRILPERL